MGSAYFDHLCTKALTDARTQGEAGIGTMQEKRLHALIKQYLCEDTDYHEVGVSGTRYVADVRIGNEIYEVQTGSFYPMKEKIAHYLENTDCTVTVVHPISVIKWVSWIDPLSGEISPRRKAPREKAEDVLAELYCLLPYLQNPRLRFRLLLLETQDFRLLSKRGRDRKKGSVRYERIPLSLVDEIDLNGPADFCRFIPSELPRRFTVKEFSALSKIRGRDAYSAVRALCGLGLLEEGERLGRSMTFVRCDGAERE